MYVYTVQTHTTLILCHIFIHHLGPFPRPTASLIYTSLTCRLTYCFIFLQQLNLTTPSSMQQVNTATALSSKLFLSFSVYKCVHLHDDFLDIYTWLSYFPLLCDRWLFMLLLRDCFEGFLPSDSIKKNTLYNFTHKQQMLYLIRALTQIPDILTIIKYIGIMYQELIKNWYRNLLSHPQRVDKFISPQCE